jgi:hypothetical protein
MELKTNHDIRIVTLVTAERVLCIFGDVRGPEETVVGYRMLYPFILTVFKANEDGSIPVQYSRFCPFSPVEEHRLSGEHIISVVYPDNGILDNYVERLKEIGMTEDQIFVTQSSDTETTEEVLNGDIGELIQTGE